MAYSKTGDGTVDSNKAYAGRYSDGTLTIYSGNYFTKLVESGKPVPGFAPTNATITVTGAGTTLTASDPGTPGSTGSIDVGFDNPGGKGYLEVLAGAAVRSYNQAYYLPGTGVIGGYSNLNVGFGLNSFGRVTVDGVGSRLETFGYSPRMNIGRDQGTGELVISGGGYGLTLQLDAGRDGATGRVTIDGAGSQLVLNSNAGTFAHPQYAGEAGIATFGRADGSGFLYVTNGGTLTVQNTDGNTDLPMLRFARENGSYGYGLVSGAGSAAYVTQFGPQGDDYAGGPILLVGDGGQGVLKVTNDGLVDVRGDQARLSVADGRYVPDGFGNFVPDNTLAQSRLEITGGADVVVHSETYGFYSGSKMFVGRARGTDGLVVVDGVGSTLTVATYTDLGDPNDPNVSDYQSAEITVGGLGTGQLDVSNGGAVYARELNVGLAAATVDPTYGHTTYTTTGYLASVDAAGSGTVNITSGGTVSITATDNAGYRGVQAGRASGTLGIINVDGAGSTLTSEGGAGQIRLGRYGTGELHISGGGQAKSFYVEAARAGTGRITVDGAGSALTVSDEFGRFPGYDGAYFGEAGFLRLGRNAGSYGYLGITNGGRVDVINDPTGNYDNPALQIARNYGATGIAVIDGAGSVLNIEQTGPEGDAFGSGPRLIVGREGYGRVTVQNDGAMTVSGDDALVIVGSGDLPGYGLVPTSKLQITSGADVTIDAGTYEGATLAIGAGRNNRGQAVVDGAGSTLTLSTATDLVFDYSSAQIVVGVYGYGRLDVSNDGAVDAREIEVGVRNDGTYAGYGLLNVNSGATVTITGSDYTPYRGLRVGQQTGATGIVNVDGAGTTLTSEGGAGRVRIADFGTGELNISNGAAVNAFFFEAARSDGSNGRVTVDGPGSVLTVSDAFGHFPLYDGAYLGEAGFMRLGRNAGSYGYMSVTDGGTVNVMNDPAYGYDFPTFAMARENGAQGVAVIDGAGSSLNVTQTGPAGDYYSTFGPNLWVGQGGYGKLTVQNGASVNVTGDKATLGVAIGYGSNNTAQQSKLLVNSGATVTVDAGTYDGATLGIATGSNTTGGAVVDGLGSSIMVDGTGGYGASALIVVGRDSGSNGQLTIQNSGTVTNAASNGVSQIAAKIGSTGAVTVDGGGSHFEAGALLTVGAGFNFSTFNVLANDGGTGLLTLLNGGHVTAGRVAVGATGTVEGNGAISGSVELLGGTLSPGLSAGTIDISGNLTANAGASVALEVLQFATPGQFDTITVGGTATLALGAIDLTLPGGAPVAAGTTTDLITAATDLALTNVDVTAVLQNAFGTVPAIGATTLNGQVQGYLLADIGNILQLQALGDDPGGAAGHVDFGVTETDGVTLTARNGFGAGTGGGLDGFALLGVSSVAGTAGADTIRLETTSDTTVLGRAGNDIIVTGAGADTIDAGIDDDVVRAGLGTDEITVGDGFDLIIGTLAELDGDTITDISAEEQIGVMDANGNFLAADINVAGGIVSIDVGGDGSVDATMTSLSGFSGAISSFPGPNPVPSEPLSVAVKGAGFVVAQVAEGDSGTKTVTFTVVRSGSLLEELTVDYTIAGSGSNPVNGDDLVGAVPRSAQVTIPAGAATATVTVEIVGDNFVEASEDLSFTIDGAATASGGSVAITGQTAFARILDDDDLAISVSNAPNVLEGDSGTTQLVFEVFRVGDTGGEVVVNYTLSGGPAGNDADLLADSNDIVGGLPQGGSITLADGQTSAQVIVEVVGDTDIEPRETVTLTLTDFTVDGSAPLTNFSQRQATGVIVNDDGTPPDPPDGLSSGAFGDPHLVTLDGLGYDFQAVGEFTLLTSSGGTNPNFDIPIEIQARMAPAPGSDLVSVNTAMATDLGGTSVMIDAFGEPALLIDGVPTQVPAGQGFVNAGNGQVFFDGSVYTIVYATGEQVEVELFEGFINIDVFLGDGREISGLLGNGDGDIGNEFELRDGTPLGATLDFDVLYGAFADSWRISDATSLFSYPAGQGTADFTDTSFPKGAIALEDLPDELVEMAEAFAAQAGITDPELLEAAILDFALTGDPNFAAGAAGVTSQPTTMAKPTNAPPLPSTVGVTVEPTAFTEGNAGTRDVVFTIYRIGDLSEPLSVDYQISGVDAADLAAGTPLSGAVSFAEGQGSAAVTVTVLGDLAVEPDEKLKLSIGVDATQFPGVLISSRSATATIRNDDFGPPSFSITALTPSVQEGTGAGNGGVLSFEITRSGSVFGTDSVDVAAGPASSGTSVDASDILGGAFPSQTLVFAPGETTKIFTVTLNPDATPEGNEAIEVSLANPSGSATIGVATASATVIDDDGAIQGTDGDDTLVGTDGDDEIDGMGGDDTIDGEAGDDTLKGGDGDDTVRGGEGKDTIFGDAGDDDLSGGEGNDLIKGGEGDDIITGGKGADLMFGDEGADCFVFEQGDGLDTIVRYEAGVDKIDLSGAGVTSLAELDISGRGNQTFVDYGDGEIRLIGVRPDELGADDFIFA